MNNLRHNLLIYIGSCLEGRFSYEKCSFDFRQLAIEHELATLRKDFSLAKKENLIAFRTHYRKPIPILTNKGKLEVKTRLAFKKFGEWDKKWRVVIFDLPQRERKYRLLLVEKLSELGFSSSFRGAYFSCWPLLNIVEKLANNWGIRQHITLLTAETADSETIVSGWNLEEIDKKYENFIKKTVRIQRHARLWPLQAKNLEQEFADIFALDPHLPKELLPKDWHGKEAYETFKEIANSY